MTSAVSFGLLFFVLAIPAFLVMFLGVVLTAALGPAAFFGVLVIVVVYLLALAAVNAALNGVFVAALYQYGLTQQPAGPFTPQMLNSAWAPK